MAWKWTSKKSKQSVIDAMALLHEDQLTSALFEWKEQFVKDPELVPSSLL